MSAELNIPDIIKQLIAVDIFNLSKHREKHVRHLTPIDNLSVGPTPTHEPKFSCMVGKTTPKGKETIFNDMMTVITSEFLYPMYLELETDTFKARFNKTIYNYVSKKLVEHRKCNVPDSDNIWMEPNIAFIEWFHNNDVEIETVKSFKDIPDVVPSEIEDSKDALWAIADDLRERKKSGEFQSYRDAYRWGENNMTQNNKPIKWKSIENAFDKAKAGGKV